MLEAAVDVTNAASASNESQECIHCFDGVQFTPNRRASSWGGVPDTSQRLRAQPAVGAGIT